MNLKWFGTYWRGIMSVVMPIILLPLIVVINTSESRCAYVMLLMAAYWMTEALPLPVTALIPVFAFPMLGVLGTSEVTVCYMTETNMMFLGGLTVAIAVEHCNLHRRIALFVLIRAGQSPRRLMLGFMMCTMFLSMWISNTATTAMMVPITEAIVAELFPKEKEVPDADGISIISTADEKQQIEDTDSQSSYTSTEVEPTDGKVELSEMGKKLRLAMLLSVAYSANIGGTGVVTGTAPNMVLMSQLQTTFGDSQPLTFASWMGFNIPGMVLCVFLAWLWLQYLFIGLRTNIIGVVTKEQETAALVLLKRKYTELGIVRFHEKVVACLFFILVGLWVFRSPQFVTGWANLIEDGYGDKPNLKVENASAALLIVVLLFMVPKSLDFWRSRNPEDKSPVSHEGCLNWKVVNDKLPWGIILLLGGGFAMAEASQQSGLSEWLGKALQHLVEKMPSAAIVFVLSLMTAMLTEVSSNTATASILLPVLKSLSLNLKMNPIYIMLPTTICCSYAFMLPVATPPNAIVFAATNMRIITMMKTGIVMNVICVCAITLMINTLGIPLFDVHSFPDWADVSLNSTHIM